MIYRFQYTAYIRSGFDINSILSQADSEAKECVKNGDCITIALFRYENILFLYLESTSDTVFAGDIIPSVTECMDGNWLSMENVYYTSIPSDEKYWSRTCDKIRLGRIGHLVPDKKQSYINYHKAIMKEGLFEGDKYLYIGLYGNTLFLYSESPKIMTHIRSNIDGKSEVIEEWRRLDPRSHFDHEFSGEANFVNLTQLFSVGREDFTNEQCV